MNPALGRFLTMDSWGGIITDPITLHKYLYADCDPVNKIDPSGHFSILGVMTAITITATIASIAIPVFTGIYLAIVNKVSVLDYIAALCSEDVWIEAAIGIGMGAVLGLGIKAIAKKLACEVVAFIGVIMSLWSLYQSINLSIDMINGGVSREQVARYLAVLTATVILTTIIGKVCFTEDTLIKTDDGYKEIKDIEGKSVAVINLRESPINEEIAGPEEMIGHSWATYYFQGSTGGVLTSIKLVETFLQRDYRGPWIDGVQFLYEGNQIDFEHVEGLREINYR